jgi:hypothetical protein
MGFDIYGRKPKNKNGKYFRSALWEWPVLHALISETCDDLLDEDELYHMAFNDGVAFTGKEAEAIASRLAEAVKDKESLASSKGKVMDMLGDGFDEEAWSKEGILSFVKFLRNSGGFEIC